MASIQEGTRAMKMSPRIRSAVNTILIQLKVMCAQPQDNKINPSTRLLNLKTWKKSSQVMLFTRVQSSQAKGKTINHRDVTLTKGFKFMGSLLGMVRNRR